MAIIISKSLSQLSIIYICSRCSNRQVLSRSVSINNITEDLAPAMFLDRCDSCDRYFDTKNAVFISIGEVCEL